MPVTLTAKKTQLSNQWRRWAESLADGGETPAVIEIIEAGAMLSIDNPLAALQADANAILEVRLLESQAAKMRADVDARVAPYGGQAGLREKVSAMRQELRRMEALVGISPFLLTAGKISGQATKIRQAHPRVFAIQAKSKKATKKGAK